MYKTYEFSYKFDDLVKLCEKHPDLDRILQRYDTKGCGETDEEGLSHWQITLDNQEKDAKFLIKAMRELSINELS